MFLSDLGPCSPFDGVETDCGINGDCVAFRNDYGGMLAACRCKNGYFGRSCDSKIKFITQSLCKINLYLNLDYGQLCQTAL